MGKHKERHFTERIGWLRAAVLGANDGIVSTASLVVGAAAASAATFTVGAALPLTIAWIGPEGFIVPLVAGGSIVFLALLGGLAAQAGGASLTLGAGRVTLWGALAMAATALVGRLFGTVV